APLKGFLFGTEEGPEYHAGEASSFLAPVEEWIARAMPATPVESSVEGLHPAAAASFDARASALVSAISTAAPPDTLPRASGSGGLYIPGRVIFGALRRELPAMDGSGYKSVSDAGAHWTLSGNGYIEFCQLCERMQATPPLRDKVSVAFVKENLF